MALTVRSLLSKVHPFRTDLEEERSIHAIQETVRKICRQTGMAKVTVAASTVANTATVSLASPVTGGDVFRVHRVRILDTALSSYRILSVVNSTDVDDVLSYRNESEGEPVSWSYAGSDIIELFPTPDAIYTLEVIASYVPEGEIDTIPLPDESEDAIVAGALATLLMLPGRNQNLSLSKDREVLFNRELSWLRAATEFGLSGRARAHGPTNTFHRWG